jgi:hypothetical protein
LSPAELGKDLTSKFRPWKLSYTKNSVIKLKRCCLKNRKKRGVGREFIKTVSHRALGSYSPQRTAVQVGSPIKMQPVSFLIKTFYDNKAAIICLQIF